MGKSRRAASPTARRPREHLTPDEAERLITAARKRTGARTPHRDATMILMAYRHGFRASELCAMRWDMLDLAQGRSHVTRRKNGRPGVHLLRGDEIRALRRLKREQVPESAHVFTTSPRRPMTPATFRKLLALIGGVAGLPFPMHPHTLRHACGYKLAHDGHDTRALQEWLGHGAGRAVRGDAVGQGQELLQPRPLAAAMQRDVLEAPRLADDGADRGLRTADRGPRTARMSASRRSTFQARRGPRWPRTR